MLIYLIGLGTGILSGLAIGGGTLLVPALIFFSGISQHIAQGISLTSFIPTAIVAVITHYRQGNINVKLSLYLIVGSLLGAFIGATFANTIDAAILQKIFGFFLIIMGLYEFFVNPHKD